MFHRPTHYRLLKRNTLSAVLALASAAAIPSAAISAVTPGTVGGGGFTTPTTTFYVSKSGDNSDGSSWTKAWKELDQINWSKVLSSNTSSVRIVIDGGSNGMRYHTALTVPPVAIGTPASSSPQKSSIDIRRAIAAGHNGNIVIDGGNKIATAVTIGLPNVRLDGLSFKGIKITGFRRHGIKVQAQPVSLAGIEIAGGIYSAVSSGGGTAVTIDPTPDQWLPANGLLVVAGMNRGEFNARGLIVHDTLHNIRVVGAVNANIRQSWVYNSSYLFNPEQQRSTFGIAVGNNNNIGIFEPELDDVKSDAIIAYLPTGVRLNDCVIGPSLGRGLIGAANADVAASNCLFLNASHANVVRHNPVYGVGLFPLPYGAFRLNHVTSFMTALNPHGVAHDALRAAPYAIPETVNDSVVYGGAVVLPANYKAGKNNTQFKTTGNTTALSDREVDPLFNADVAAFGNDVSPQTLMRTNFSLSQNSPATGEGSLLTSVKQLLNSPLP